MNTASQPETTFKKALKNLLYFLPAPLKAYLSGLYLFTFGARKSFSQLAEDLVIETYLDTKIKGFYVDVGCYHPKHKSNTLRLHKAGWTGLNIDLDAHKILLFKLFRPQDHNVCIAIGEQIGKATVYQDSLYSARNTINQAFAQRSEAVERNIIECKPLSLVLEELSITNIDYLNIDAEGSDLQVLLSLDLNQFRPKVITIEDFCYFLTDILESPIYKHLSQYAYRPVAKSGQTFVYVDSTP